MGVVPRDIERRQSVPVADANIGPRPTRNDASSKRPSGRRSAAGSSRPRVRIDLRAAVKEEGDAGFITDASGNVQRRQAIHAPRPDVGAAVKQLLGDDLVLRPQRRQEQRRPPVLVSEVGWRTARARRRRAPGRYSAIASKSSRLALTSSPSFGARCGATSRGSSRTSLCRRACDSS